MPWQRQRRASSPALWMVAILALLLLVVLLAAASHSPAAVCALVLLPVFLFSLVELPSYIPEEAPEGAYSIQDGSPSRFQRPPPSLA